MGARAPRRDAAEHGRAADHALAGAPLAASPASSTRRVGDAIARLAARRSATLRSLITDLRPAALDELGTLGAVEALVERVARNGLEVDLSVDLAYEQGRGRRGTPPSSRRRSTGSSGGADERRQARSRDARGRRDRRGRRRPSTSTVRDDGAGFDPAERTDGFGLLGMRERVQLLDGTLEIESSSRRGDDGERDLPGSAARRRPEAEVRDIRSAPADVDELLAYRDRFPILARLHVPDQPLARGDAGGGRGPAARVRAHVARARHPLVGRGLVGDAGHRRRPDRADHRRAARHASSCTRT